jgi:hypothetical protein
MAHLTILPNNDSGFFLPCLETLTGLEILVLKGESPSSRRCNNNSMKWNNKTTIWPFWVLYTMKAKGKNWR